MARRDGAILWINEKPAETRSLSRADLRLTASGDGYDEAWLQTLLYRNPEVLPIEQIEPGFGKLIPLCRELGLTFGAGRSGSLDNIFITTEGRLVLVEAKLWRNPEARRTVVAQAMEYAAAVFRLNYEELQSAVLHARSSEPGLPSSMYELVKQHQETLDEPEFVDAVNRNLKRGRAIVAVVGDGIREDLAPLAELLQTHAGHRFTFALVELAIYETPQPGIRVVAPSVLAQTALIERGVVLIEDGSDGTKRIAIRESPVTPAQSSRERSFGIGEDEFYEILGQKEPKAPALLKSFLAKLDGLGVRAELQGGLNLKHTAPKGRDLNLGTINKVGYFDSAPSTWWERTDIGRKYNETLATLTGGLVRDLRDGQSTLKTTDGKTPRLLDLLPKHEDAWIAAIDRYIRDAFEAARED